MGNEIPNYDPQPGCSEKILPDAHFSPRNTRSRASAQLMQEIGLR